MGKAGESDPLSARAFRPSGVASVYPHTEAGAAEAPQADDNERRLRFLTDHVPTIMLYQLLIEANGARRFTYVSGGVEPMHGLSAEQVLADASLLYGQIHDDDKLRVAEAEARSLRDGTLFEVEMRSVGKHGQRWVMLRSAPRSLPDGATIWDGVEIDITAAKTQEAERARLEDSLRQAQKMESVGRLAGGVAHDFNNMLTAIMGNIAMARLELPDESALSELLDEASSAARAAENLTRQLLAFSRKQVIVPKVLNLNEVATRMRKMLARVLGEDVVLNTSLANDLAVTRADPGQIEQILVNLAVNARDAMPSGGVLTLSTDNVTLGVDEARALEVEPGEFVRLSVRDDGTGMTPEVKSRLFEPFFTTKGVGKGTGLGLSMVYGAMKQSDGGVDVTSTLGQGSEFRLYFPCVTPTRESTLPAPRSALFRGNETILVVEDEPLVRSLSRSILERQGYRVLLCASGAEALRVLGEHPEPIHLLLTDLVMPGMGGRELAQRIAAQRPHVRVLFTSGYAEDAAVERTAVDQRAQFLAKPYSVQELSRRVRELLDAAEP